MTTEERIKNEEVLAKLKLFRVEDRATGIFRLMDNDAVNEAMEMLDVCIKAVEKQTPKRPDGGAEREEEIGKIGYDWCPVCHDMVTRKYCPNCGQKIDWSGND